MYNVLKKQKRMLGPTRRTISCEPISSGREGTIASSDEGELNAIANAMRKGRPIYFVRTDDGVTLDVMLSKTDALNYRDSARERISSMRNRIQIFERIGSTTPLMRVA